MKKPRSILLYLNQGSSIGALLGRVEALALENQAFLHVVDVLPSPEDTRFTLRGALKSGQNKVNARLKELGTCVEPALRRGVTAQVEVLVGRPVVQINRAVVRNRHDLVVLSGAAQPGHQNDPLGGTVRGLLRESPCPVWVIKGNERSAHRRVLAALDAGEDWSRDQRESKRVLELAKSMAGFGSSELRIVYCLAHWNYGSATGSVANGLGGQDNQLEQLLAKCDLGCVRHDVRLVTEPAADVIAELCEEVDVLVMGTVWRSGPVGLLIADAAAEALDRVDCSVLVVKPESATVPRGYGGRPCSQAA